MTDPAEPRFNEPRFDESERELLRLASPPIALDPAKLQTTLQRAREHAATQARRRRTRFWIGLGLCAAALVALTFFGVFDARHKGLPPTLTAALQVTRNAGEFDRGDVQAAMHKLYQVTHRLLAVVKASPDLERRARDAVLQALDGPIAPVAYDGGFEAVLAKVERREPLAEAELTILTAAARASVIGLRALGNEHSLHAAEIRVLCNYLQEEASPVDPTKVDPKGKARQE